MERFRTIFGDEALTWAEFEAAAAAAGVGMGDARYEAVAAELDALRRSYDADLLAARLESAVELALHAARAKNPRIARGAIDMSALSMDGDRILGLEEQIAALKRSDAYLFEQAGRPRAFTGAQHGGMEGDPAGMTDEEYYTALKTLRSRR